MYEFLIAIHISISYTSGSGNSGGNDLRPSPPTLA